MPFSVRASVNLALAIISLILTLLLMLIVGVLDMEERTEELGEESTSLAPGRTFLLPSSYSENDSHIYDDLWELRGTVKVRGPKALIVVGLDDEIRKLAEDLQRGKSPFGLESRPGFYVYYLQNDTLDFRVPVEVEGEYMVAVHNTFRPQSEKLNDTEGSRLDLYVKFYAYNTFYDDYFYLGKGLMAFIVGLMSLTTALFFFLFSAHRASGEERLNFIKIFGRHTKEVSILLIITGVLAATTVIKYGSCFIAPFLLIGLIIYALKSPKKLQPTVEMPYTPVERVPLGIGAQVEVEGERATLHLVISNRSDVRLEELEITPVVAPGHTLYGLGEEYVSWIEPGEKARVDFIFRKYGKKPERIPVYFKISYYAGGERREYTTGQYIINI